MLDSDVKINLRLKTESNLPSVELSSDSLMELDSIYTKYDYFEPTLNPKLFNLESLSKDAFNFRQNYLEQNIGYIIIKNFWNPKYSIEQAKNLHLILNEFDQKIDLIISLVVPREIIEKRIIGRVTCDKCNLTLNEFFNKEDIELHPCGKEFFVKRKDDNVKTIMSRYDIYTKTTEPVLNFLSKNSNFQEIDGTLEIDEITRKIDTFINV